MCLQEKGEDLFHILCVCTGVTQGGRGGGEGGRRPGRATPRFAHESFERDLGTRPECRQRVSVKHCGNKSTCYPRVNSARLSHCAIASP